MSTYTHIMVGLDLSSDSKQIMEKAKFLANSVTAQLSIVHIIEPLLFTYGGDIPMDISSIQDQIHTQAQIDLRKIGQEFSIPESNQHISIGPPASELHEIAANEKADLIIVGSHGRHGLSLILGSTSNSVLHGSHCDVLAIRVQSED